LVPESDLEILLLSVNVLINVHHDGCIKIIRDLHIHDNFFNLSFIDDLYVSTSLFIILPIFESLPGIGRSLNSCKLPEDVAKAELREKGAKTAC
jgi:hypothetical protein